MVIRCLSAAVLALTAWGCGDVGPAPDESRAAAISRESVWDASEGWRVEARPHLVVSGSEDDALLTRVTDTWIDDGLLVVANFQSPPALRAYELDGSPAWSVEREGEGPGEFRTIVRAWPWPEGRVTAYDPFGGRLTSFGREGTNPVGTRLDWLPGSGMIGTVLLGPVSDSLLVARPNVGPLPEGVREGRVMEPLYRLNIRSRSWDTLAVVPRWDLFIDSEGGSHMPIFGRRSVLTTDADRIVWGIGDDYTLHDLDPSDGGEVVFGRAYEPRPVTEALADSLRLRRLAGLSGPQAEAMRARTERWFREAPRAETLPAYDRILLGPSGEVWVRNYVAPGDGPEVWSVFDGERRWLGEVEMPAGLEARHVSHEWLTGVVQDDFDVPHVQVHRIFRR